MKIIHFYEKYGEDATLVAFGASRKVISRWKQRLTRCGGSLSALITYYFSYPRCPKINSFIERYNRTIQEEFIDNNLDIIFDKQLFHEKLTDYLIFYNTKRPHKSLGLKSPIDYLIENGKMSQMCLTYT